MKIALRSPDNSVWKVAAHEYNGGQRQLILCRLILTLILCSKEFCRCSVLHAILRMQRFYIYDHLPHIAYETSY